MTVIHADCLDAMAAMDADSVDAIVCDPPYGLSFMGKQWDHGVPGEPFWREALRVAKPGAHLVAFGGTRTYHRLACAIEDAGWEVRDCLSWNFGSGFPKSHNLDGDWQGWGTALKPAWEPIILARKPLIGTVAANVAAHGTGALNVDGCRIGTEIVRVNNYSDGKDCTSWSGSRAGLPYESREQSGRWPANVCLDEDAAGMLDAQSGERGGGSRSVRVVETDEGRDDESQYRIKPTVGTIRDHGDAGGASRFFFVAREGQCDNASNAAASSSRSSELDGSAPSDAVTSANREAVLPSRCQRGRDCIGDCIDCTRRQSRASSAEEPDSIGTTPTTPTSCESCGSALHATADSTSQASAARAADASDPVSGTRFLYSPKASRREREAGLEDCDKVVKHFWQTANGASGEPSSLAIASNPNKVARTNNHPTVKPIALMRWLCRLVTPPNGLVLDPFTGSGTTGCAAVLEGFRFVGIEREAEYVAIAEKRIAHWAGQRTVPEPDLFGDAA